MPPHHHSKSKLQAVLEESTSTAIKHPSVTTAVKSMANVLLGPRGKTPIENMLTMQHFQLWGFVLVVAGLVYIVWLMQKKLDNIDKQYKEQFVLLHRLFKSHQDLQVEVRKKNPAPNTTSPAMATTNPPPAVSLALEAEDEINFDEQPEPEPESIENSEAEEVCEEMVSTAEPSEAFASDEEESVVQEEEEDNLEADYEEYEENE